MRSGTGNCNALCKNTRKIMYSALQTAGFASGVWLLHLLAWLFVSQYPHSLDFRSEVLGQHECYITYYATVFVMLFSIPKY